jgi:DNA-binding PadR family transcriptional regulator
MLETRNFPATFVEKTGNLDNNDNHSETVSMEAPRRSWRMAFIDLQILSLLHSQRLTGYSIRKNLNARFGILISFGTLYPRLKFLERVHVLKSVVASRSPNSPGVVTYELTEKGVDDLKSGLVSYQNSLRTMEQILELRTD